MNLIVVINKANKQQSLVFTVQCVEEIVMFKNILAVPVRTEYFLYIYLREYCGKPFLILAMKCFNFGLLSLQLLVV